ncbi:hypothetical protein [Actinoplanes utahensis]|uniref:hypothetical protein n=1 Tax=Actinoplanes utahensis TaxID=1869 RepID=UPI00360E4B18
MSVSNPRFRLAMAGAGLGFVAVALAIRAVAPIGGRLEQSSATALYASMIWAGFWSCGRGSPRSPPERRLWPGAGAPNCSS